MKYEKTDSFKNTADSDQWIAEAMEEAVDQEVKDFLSHIASDAEISEDLDRKIGELLEKQSAKERFQNKYYPRILSTAALVTFVAFFFSFVAMMSAFVKFSGNGTVPQLTDITGDVSGTSSDSFSEPSQLTSVSASTKNTEYPSGQTEMTDSDGRESTCKEQNSTDPVYGRVPSDEESAVRVITKDHEDGIFLCISIVGYQSKSLGKDFYVKSNEYFTVSVEVTNRSSRMLYRIAGTDCSESAVPHSHDIALDLSCNGRSLCSSSIGFSCGKTFAREPLKPGETYTYQLRYAAGEEVASGFDLPGGGTDYPAGVKLYNQVFYHNGSCEFQGYLVFDYGKEKNGTGTSVALPLSLEVLYVK